MQRSRTFRVSGLVMDAEGLAPATVCLNLTQFDKNTSTGRPIESGPAGAFTASGLTPGQFALQADIAGSCGTDQPRAHEIGYVRFRVDASDVDGLIVTTRKEAKIVGHVTFKDGVPPQAIGPLIVVVQEDGNWQDRMRTGPTPVAQVEADLTFEVAGLFGPQALSVHGIPSSWTLAEIRYKGVDITDVPTEFTTTTDPRALDVVLTSRGAEIVGRVVDAAGAPAADGRVMLFAVDPSRWSLRASTTTSASIKDGAFRAGPHRAGDYLIVALPSRDADLAILPNGFTRLAQIAQRVTLVENDRRTLDLQLAKPK